MTKNKETWHVPHICAYCKHWLIGEDIGTRMNALAVCTPVPCDLHNCEPCGSGTCSNFETIKEAE